MDATLGSVLAAGERIDGPLLAAGLVLHLIADVVRNSGWHGALRAAGPRLRRVRLRDVQAAAFAGGGANAVVPARGGDVLKVVLIRRRAPAAPLPTVAATLVVESLLESAAGALLLAWALWQGFVPVETLTAAIASASGRPLLAAAVGVTAAGVVALACALLRRRARRVVGDLKSGLAVLRSPRVVVLRVAGPQLAGRVVRLAAIACCLSACGLPAGVAAAAVTMAVDGGTRVRFAPAAAGLRVGLLSYGLPAATGVAVSAGSAVAYVAVMAAARTALSVAIAAAVLLAMVGRRSPRRALDAVRRLRRAADPLQVDPAALPAEAARGPGSL
jgi:hypothetical protein